MSVLSSLFSGISGLVSNGSALSVIGDNISNVNTVGFKRGQATFENALTQKIGNAQIGLGSRLSSVATNFSQASFENTENETDLAISGNGFFVVKGAEGQFYTRAGNFYAHKDGTIINPAGYALQGYAIDSDGNPTGELTDIEVSDQTSAPVATSNVVSKLNLDARAADTVWNAADSASFAAASAKAAFSAPMTVYDSLGNAHSVTMYFNKTATANTWQYHALVDIDDVTDGDITDHAAGGSTISIGQGTLEFDTDGSIKTVTPDTTAAREALAAGGNVVPGHFYVNVPWKGADSIATDDGNAAWTTSELTFDFGLRGTTPTSGKVTQYSQNSQIISTGPNGRPAGSVSGFAFNEDGYLVGQFTNGETRKLFRVAVATFASQQNLERKGGNLWAQTADSGEANINFANTAGRGKIQGNKLEMSNVDLATEFVKMVITQRGFQASARTISTTDQLLAELVNLGR